MANSDIFYLSLSEEIKDRLVTVDLLSSFEALVVLAIKINNHPQQQGESRHAGVGGSHM